MTNETIEWQKEQAQKLFNFIQKRLEFDDLIVKLPNNHQLNQIKDVTVKKFISYVLSKINNEQSKIDGIIVQGYIDDDDIIGLLNIFHQIIQLTDTQVRKDLNLMYRYLNEVIIQYENEFKTITQLQTQLLNLKKDFKNQEELVNKVKKMEDEIQHKLTKTKKRVEELVKEVEMIWDIRREEVIKEKPIQFPNPR